MFVLILDNDEPSQLLVLLVSSVDRLPVAGTVIIWYSCAYKNALAVNWFEHQNATAFLFFQRTKVSLTLG